MSKNDTEIRGPEYEAPTYTVVVEQHNRRESIVSIASTPEEAMVDALNCYTSICEQTVGSVEIRHNDSSYTVVGIVKGADDPEASLWIDEQEQDGVLNAGGICVRVSR